MTFGYQKEKIEKQRNGYEKIVREPPHIQLIFVNFEFRYISNNSNRKHLNIAGIWFHQHSIDYEYSMRHACTASNL